MISYFRGAEIIAISWLAPFDRAMYVQFHPVMHRLPPWGPRGHAWRPAGRYPVGYVMYYLLPALINWRNMPGFADIDHLVDYVGAAWDA